MEKTLETDDRGVLQLSADLLGNTPPRTRYVVEVRGAELRLRREDGLPLWQTATARERASAFREWATRPRQSPGLPDEALRRDSFYD